MFIDYLAERVGFEPTVPCGTPDFESGTFGHSATSPATQALDCSSGPDRHLPGFGIQQRLQRVCNVLGLHVQTPLQLVFQFSQGARALGLQLGNGLARHFG